MSLLDLHVHSTASDGTLSPTNLVKHAKQQGVTVFALTDHDTVAGIPEAIEVAEKVGVTLIPGIEIGAKFGEDEMHILGLYIDHTSEKLKQSLKDLIEIRESRNDKMIEKFQSLGISITLEELQETAGGSVISRAHVARLLKEKGYISSIGEAFEKYIGPGQPAFVGKLGLPPKEIIQMILDAQGIPVLAHPKLLKLPNEEFEKLLLELISYGLQGIEAIYSLHDPEEEEYFKGLAKKYDLLITGGSDFHGENKPTIQIGVGKGNLNIPMKILEALRK